MFICLFVTLDSYRQAPHMWYSSVRNNVLLLWYMYGTTVTFRIYAYSNLANCKFTLVQYCNAGIENNASVTVQKIKDSKRNQDS